MAFPMKGRIFHKRAVRECDTGARDTPDVSNGEGSGSTMSFEQLCASLARSAALRLHEKAAA